MPDYRPESRAVKMSGISVDVSTFFKIHLCFRNLCFSLFLTQYMEICELTRTKYTHEIIRLLEPQVNEYNSSGLVGRGGMWISQTFVLRLQRNPSIE